MIDWLKKLATRVEREPWAYPELNDNLDLPAIIAALEDGERLRAKAELLEIEVAEWKRLVEDSCGCIPQYPDDLPEDFHERWRAVG